MRVLHLSDVHVEVAAAEVRPRDLLGKRLAGWANLHFGPRRKHFAGAGERFARVLEQVRRLEPDFVVLSGDLTAVGVREEFERFRDLAAPYFGDGSRWLVVPGNHDRYTVPSEREEVFQQVLGSWRRADVELHGRRTPYARLVGDELVLVVVETCEANRMFWDSRGRVEHDELEALEALLALPALAGRPYWLVTHYAPYGPGGRPDASLHGLRNLDDVLAILRRRPPELWLHGHIHHSYALLGGQAEFATVNAGSATHHHRASFHLYEREGASWTLRSLDPSVDPPSERWRRTWSPRGIEAGISKEG